MLALRSESAGVPSQPLRPAIPDARTGWSALPTAQPAMAQARGAVTTSMALGAWQFVRWSCLVGHEDGDGTSMVVRLLWSVDVLLLAGATLLFAVLLWQWLRELWQWLREPATPPPKAAATPAAEDEGADAGTPCRILLVDADNVRAALAWPPREAFRRSVCRWSSTQPDLAAVILASDGGGDMGATLLGARVVLTTSGRWRADDTIVRDVRWLFANGQDELTVVTSDKLLRRRCRAARDAAGQRVRFQASEEFASRLPAWSDESAIAEPAAPACLQRRLRAFLEWAASAPRPSTAARERMDLGGASSSRKRSP